MATLNANRGAAAPRPVFTAEYLREVRVTRDDNAPAIRTPGPRLNLRYVDCVFGDFIAQEPLIAPVSLLILAGARGIQSCLKEGDDVLLSFRDEECVRLFLAQALSWLGMTPSESAEPADADE